MNVSNITTHSSQTREFSAYLVLLALLSGFLQTSEYYRTLRKVIHGVHEGDTRSAKSCTRKMNPRRLDNRTIKRIRQGARGVPKVRTGCQTCKYVFPYSVSVIGGNSHARFSISPISCSPVFEAKQDLCNIGATLSPKTGPIPTKS